MIAQKSACDPNAAIYRLCMLQRTHNLLREEGSTFLCPDEARRVLESFVPLSSALMSLGLDIPEMHKGLVKELAEMWQDMWRKSPNCPHLVHQWIAYAKTKIQAAHDITRAAATLN